MSNGNSTEARKARFTPERIAKMVAGRRASLLSIADRFWRRVDKNGPVFEDKGPCWIWQGPPKADGYGQFWRNGTVKYAHRVALDLLGIVIPEGMDADHMCRNRICVSPHHLRAVTERINAIENNDSPFAKYARRTTCKYGHDITSPGNVALMACKGPKGTPMLTRNCLTCTPSNWNNPHRIFVTA